MVLDTQLFLLWLNWLVTVIGDVSPNTSLSGRLLFWCLYVHRCGKSLGTDPGGSGGVGGTGRGAAGGVVSGGLRNRLRSSPSRSFSETGCCPRWAQRPAHTWAGACCRRSAPACVTTGRGAGLGLWAYQRLPCSGISSLRCRERSRLATTFPISPARQSPGTPVCSWSSVGETVTPGQPRPAAADTPAVSLSEVPLGSPGAAKSCQAQVRRGGAGPQAQRGPCHFARGPGCTASGDGRQRLGAAASQHRGAGQGSGPARGPERGRVPYGRRLVTPGAGRAWGTGTAANRKPVWSGRGGACGRACGGGTEPTGVGPTGDLAPPLRRGREPRSPAAGAASGPRAGRSRAMRGAVRGGGLRIGAAGVSAPTRLSRLLPGASRDARVSGPEDAGWGRPALSPAVVVAEPGTGSPRRSPRRRGDRRGGGGGGGRGPAGRAGALRACGRKCGASSGLSGFQRRRTSARGFRVKFCVWTLNRPRQHNSKSPVDFDFRIWRWNIEGLLSNQNGRGGWADESGAGVLAGTHGPHAAWPWVGVTSLGLRSFAVKRVLMSRGVPRVGGEEEGALQMAGTVPGLCTSLVHTD